MTKFPLTPNDARAWSVWLAAEFQVELDDRDRARDPRLAAGLLDDLRTGLTQVLDHSEAMDAIDRTRVGELLGVLGDPRPGVGVRDGVPDFSWCKCDGQTFSLGLTPEEIVKVEKMDLATSWGLGRESPAVEASIETFHISRFPVTTAQFRSFVDHGGYRQSQYWDQYAWPYVESGRLFWSDSDRLRATAGNLPATGVSLFEAKAFCRWICEDTGQMVFVPSEAEWEFAARGPDRRLFPWGDQFAESLCNSQSLGLGHPCAVGCFGSTPTPWGVGGPLDMAGNIWEWTTSPAPDADKGYTQDQQFDIEISDNQMVVVRGGSYLNVPFVVRSSYRGRDWAVSKFPRQGFRVARR
jgi:formylglycine-generating enzyme required for sulfatase activity